mmetsp:Transcript_11267/g.24766  ORF Transcript_11267/g.24766 Transcript_11267/m.24766 type:complete len:265 (-) Transcript_11267:346-1140(-)
MKPDSNLFSNQAPVTSNDGRDQKRELCGGRSTEDVTSLAQKRMVQRLVGATAKRKLQCEELLKDWWDSNSKRSSKACSSSKSGKTEPLNSTSKSKGSSNSINKSGKTSKGSKRDCKYPTSKPTLEPTVSRDPSLLPSARPSEIPSSTPTVRPSEIPSLTPTARTFYEAFDGNSYSANTNYNYSAKIGTGGEFRQSSIYLIGYFESFIGNTAYYSGGTYCYAIDKNRSGKVIFVEDCSASSITVSVTEPSTCYYEMVVSGVCRSS